MLDIKEKIVRYFKVLFHKEIEDLDNFILPYKKELDNVKNLISLMGLEYFLEHGEKSFYLEVNYNKGAILICHAENEVRLFPIYTIKVYNILVSVYEVPVKYTKQSRAINISELESSLVQQILKDNS